MNQNYNGKTSLMICYQWHMTDNGSDVIVLNKTFDTLEEAYTEMERVMPDNYEGDDGYDFDEWNKYMEEGDPDIFMQYNAQIDKEHNLLAVFRPAEEKPKTKKKDSYTSEDIDRDEYQNKIIELFAQCITDPTNKRIIIDRNRPMDDYYMIDFSSYGQPFEDDTLVTITWYSEDDEKSGDYLEEHNNYIDAANKVAKLLDEGFNEIYVTNY